MASTPKSTKSVGVSTPSTPTISNSQSRASTSSALETPTSSQTSMDTPTSRKRKSYTIAQKLEILGDLRGKFDGNKTQCAKHHGVDPSNLRRWLAIEHKMVEGANQRKRRRVDGAGQKPKYGELEKKLFEMVTEDRNAKILVNYRRVKELSLRIAQELGIENFEMTDKIVFGFVRRHNLTFRAVTHVAQEDNCPIEMRIQSAKNHIDIIGAMTKGISADCIYNMDETPCYLDMSSGKTLHFKGEKNIEGADTGHSKTRFTVVLTVAMSGKVLKAMIILKGLKKVPKVSIPSNVVLTVSMGGSMNEPLMMTWMQKVLDSRNPFQTRKSSVLVMDRYGSHLKDSVQKALSDRNIQTKYIPAGMTSLLQPLDVAINAAFKARMREEWEDWFTNGEKEYTVKGNRKRPGWDKVVKFVSRSITKLDLSKFTKAFECCGIGEDGKKVEMDELNTNLKSLLVKQKGETEGTAVNQSVVDGLDDEAEEEQDLVVDEKNGESDDEPLSDEN